MELSLARSFALSCDPERGEIDDERANINDLEYVEQNTGKENLDRVAEQYIINDDECENESVKEYTVEKVIEHKFKKGKLQLKWKGWSPEYNTWENHENVFSVIIHFHLIILVSGNIFERNDFQKLRS
ncbi:unnamed protein product [Rhizophagus irregularis]|nr:unnamed protein product [Rhizophagus irregularis]